MKFLLDQGLPRDAVPLLAGRGIDAVHTGDVGLAAATDDVILDWARSESRVVVSLNSDFHHLIALTRQSTPSVIRIRVEGLRAEALVNLLAAVHRQCSSELESGAMISVQETRLRIRRLPLK